MSMLFVRCFLSNASLPNLLTNFYLSALLSSSHNHYLTPYLYSIAPSHSLGRVKLLMMIEADWLTSPINRSKNTSIIA